MGRLAEAIPRREIAKTRREIAKTRREIAKTRREIAKPLLAKPMGRLAEAISRLADPIPRFAKAIPRARIPLEAPGSRRRVEVAEDLLDPIERVPQVQGDLAGDLVGVGQVL